MPGRVLTPHRPLIGYIILAVFAITGAWRLEYAINKVDEEAKARAKSQCLSQNDVRRATQEAFRKYNDVLISSAVNGNRERTPEQQEALNEQIDKFKTDIEKTVIAPLEPLDCGKVRNLRAIHVEVDSLWEEAGDLFQKFVATVGLDGSRPANEASAPNATVDGGSGSATDAPHNRAVSPSAPDRPEGSKTPNKSPPDSESPPSTQPSPSPPNPPPEANDGIICTLVPAVKRVSASLCII